MGIKEAKREVRVLLAKESPYLLHVMSQDKNSVWLGLGGEGSGGTLCMGGSVWSTGKLLWVSHISEISVSTLWITNRTQKE